MTTPLLTCPTILLLKCYPWRYVCGQPYTAGQTVCVKCGKALPKS